jgi:hypothetical protein
LSDPESEKFYHFSLRESFLRAKEKKLLEGMQIYVTPKTKPTPEEMKEIIECAHGTVNSL